MSCTDKNFRLVIKQGSGVPTVPPSSDHRNGDWIDTDIYEGEFYQDTDTGKVYTRNSTGITGVSGSAFSGSVELDLSDINNLSTTPVVLGTAAAGLAINFLRPPVLKTDDDGTPFVFGSGETINLRNTDGTAPDMASFGDNAIFTGSYTAFYYGNHALVTGDVSITSSIAITGGGANASMIFTFEYELVVL